LVTNGIGDWFLTALVISYELRVADRAQCDPPLGAQRRISEWIDSRCAFAVRARAVPDSTVRA